MNQSTNTSKNYYGLLFTSLLLIFTPVILELLKDNGVLNGGPIEERKTAYVIMGVLGSLCILTWILHTASKQIGRKTVPIKKV